MERLIEMFQAMEKSLIQNKFFQPPNIYVKPEADKGVANKLKEIIKRRGGQTIDSEEAATHILYPHCDPLEEEYARPGNTVKSSRYRQPLRVLHF